VNSILVPGAVRVFLFYDWSFLHASPLFRSILFFAARRYASAVYAVVVCLSVCLSVSPTHAGIASKRLNIKSRKQRRTIARNSDAKDLGEIPTGSSQTGSTK